MMNDTAIIRAEGCPAEMLAAQDVPWEFIGELYTPGQSKRAGVELALCVPSIPTRCLRRYCACSFLQPEHFQPTAVPEPGEVRVLDLLRYEFIDADMLRIVVFWGRCHGCGRVAWARVGPPWERERSFAFTS